jgi:hypothetical protein
VRKKLSTELWQSDIWNLPVGDFITDALGNDVPKLAREVLQSNVQDEIKHDLALGYITNAIGVDEQAEARKPCASATLGLLTQITRSSKRIGCRTCRFSLCYYPFFRFNGDAGLRTVSADISRDEQVHVATNNSLVCT